MKKIISLILTVVMLFAMASPAVTANASGGEVTIYIEGYGNSLVDAEGNYIWYNGPTKSMLTGLKDVLSDLLFDLAVGKFTGDYTTYCDRLYNAMAPAFADIILDKNGNAGNGSGIRRDMLNDPYSVSYEHFSTGSIRFEYDWRLSAEENGEILEKFINRVCLEKGFGKVNILGRCLGGNVISAYLQNGKNLDKINKIIMYIPSTEGVDFISALFSGEVYLKDDNIENFINYSLPDLIEFEDAQTAETIKTLVEFFNEITLLGFGADFIQDILDDVKANVLARIVRDTYGSFVSFWSMVSDEYLEDAIAFVYNTPELQEEYAVMIEKIRSYHENVQVTARDRMLELKDQGKEIMVISKYNKANFPLSKDSNAQSDGTALTVATSFGAKVAEFGSLLTDEYITTIPEENLKYLSKDKMIDASSCVLPDNTWFVKNISHDNFPPSIDKLIEKFITTDNMTVFSENTYPQYLKYDKETDSLSPVEGVDDNDVHMQGAEKRISVFIRIILMILEFLQKLFSGQLFPGNMGVEK